MTNLSEQSAVRAVLRNELTWIVFIIGFVWGGVTWIILPLQKVQIEIANVQVTLSEIKVIAAEGITKDNDLDKRLSLLEIR